MFSKIYFDLLSWDILSAVPAPVPSRWPVSLQLNLAVEVSVILELTVFSRLHRRVRLESVYSARRGVLYGVMSAAMTNFHRWPELLVRNEGTGPTYYPELRYRTSFPTQKNTKMKTVQWGRGPSIKKRGGKKKHQVELVQHRVKSRVKTPFCV